MTPGLDRALWGGGGGDLEIDMKSQILRQLYHIDRSIVSIKGSLL